MSSDTDSSPCESLACVGVSDASSRFVGETLSTSGAVLIRGLDLETPDHLARAISRLFPDDRFAAYREAASPRTKLSAEVYTSTEYDPSGTIFYHQENAQCTTWPDRIFFYCATPAASGGSTPIVDLQGIESELDPGFVAKIRAEGVRYERNFSPRLGMSLDRVFGSSDPDVIADYCEANEMAPEWLDEGHLRIRFSRPAFRQDPASNALRWFNHIAFYAPQSRDPRTARLLRLVPERFHPFAVTYADGSAIPNSVLEDLCTRMHRRAVRAAWRAGDLLCLNNLRFAHGRDPFSGDRLIWVTMSGLRS